MRRACASLTIVAVVLSVGIVYRTRSGALAGEEPLLPPRAVAGGPQSQGVASCAAAACHNGNGLPGSKGSEYTTWAARDPHSRAYQVLFDERSVRMAKILGRGKKAHEDGLCLSCHVQPECEDLRKGPRWTAQDGVGCEACHGAAEKWLSVHYQRPGERRSLGMTDTRDLQVRAQVCVQCHVGESDADVNHDLIAAGHPRLRFELGAYLANYPRHWDYGKDRERYPDFEARAWLLGQVESARAAVDLLAWRTQKPETWPEFAEYGCFSCHQEIRAALRPRPLAGAGKIGELRWGTWYGSLLPGLPALERAGRPADLKASLDELRDLMGKSYPNRQQVAEQAKKVSAELVRWSDGLAKTSSKVSTQEHLLAGLAGDDRRPVVDGWDGAAQLYLGIAALYRGLGDSEGRFRGDAKLKEAIQALAVRLDESFRDPKHPHRPYDSPRDYDSKQFNDDLLRLRELLQRRGLP
jgi:hypothetical protein